MNLRDIAGILAGGPSSPGTALFVIDPNGGIRAATDGNRPTVGNGDSVIKLAGLAHGVS